MDAKVVDNPAKHRFELDVGDGVAVAYYRTDESGRLVLTHTEVPQELSGRGLGSKLATGVFEELKAKGSRVVAKCPFMAGFAAKRPDYAAMLDG
jgi:uncharacterized protein